MLITAKIHLNGTDMASVDSGQIFLDKVYKAEGDYIAILEYEHLVGYHIKRLTPMCRFGEIEFD